MRGGKTETCAYNPTTGEKQNLSEALAALGANRREAALGALAAARLGLCTDAWLQTDLVSMLILISDNWAVKCSMWWF